MSQVTGGDLLQEAIAELYACDPGEFIERRSALAARARTAGEAAMAKEVAALGRRALAVPTDVADAAAAAVLH